MGADFSLYAIRGAADINRRGNSYSFAITRFHLRGKRLRVSRFYQVNRAAAETPSGHARAVNTRQAFRRFHHGIQFWTTDFV